MKPPVVQLTVEMATSAALATSDATVPEWVKLIPAGTFTLRDGRGPFTTGDRTNLRAIVARSMADAGNTELMVDYDHQSIFAANDKVGGTAPAAGWIKELEARDDGIWARIEWTDAAAAKIRAREYRYISPLFTHARIGGNVERLMNAALVNVPAIDFRAIAASLGRSVGASELQMGADLSQGTTIDFLRSAEALAAAAAAIQKERQELGQPVSIAAAVDLAERRAFGLSNSANDPIVIAQELAAAAVKIQRDRASIGIPIGLAAAVQIAHENYLSHGSQQSSASLTIAAEVAVSAAIDVGKVRERDRRWAAAYASRDLAGFADLVTKLPILSTADAGR